MVSNRLGGLCVAPRPRIGRLFTAHPGSAWSCIFGFYSVFRKTAPKSVVGQVDPLPQVCQVRRRTTHALGAGLDSARSSTQGPSNVAGEHHEGVCENLPGPGSRDHPLGPPARHLRGRDLRGRDGDGPAHHVRRPHAPGGERGRKLGARPGAPAPHGLPHHRLRAGPVGAGADEPGRDRGTAPHRQVRAGAHRAAGRRRASGAEAR